jgi:lipoic acid synthetase
MKPAWLKINKSPQAVYEKVKAILNEEKVNTVCVSARCPNRLSCWSKKGVTFMILGDVCTRHCKFCAVKTGNPQGKVSEDEVSKIISVLRKLNLSRVIITSVTRDDLLDGGAEQFARVIKKIRKEFSFNLKIEVLVPDFQGNGDLIRTIIEAGPDVFAHNIETVRRLTPIIRDPRAHYDRSLNVLKIARELNPLIETKSGFMLGLGETEEEVLLTISDLKAAKVDILTIGQYLQPTPKAIPVYEYVRPEKFLEYQDHAYKLGFKKVFAAPFIRSSYIVEEE